MSGLVRDPASCDRRADGCSADPSADRNASAEKWVDTGGTVGEILTPLEEGERSGSFTIDPVFEECQEEYFDSCLQDYGEEPGLTFDTPAPGTYQLFYAGEEEELLPRPDPEALRLRGRMKEDSLPPSPVPGQQANTGEQQGGEAQAATRPRLRQDCGAAKGGGHLGDRQD